MIKSNYHREYYQINKEKILNQNRIYSQNYIRIKGKCSVCGKDTSRTSITRCKSCKQLDELNSQWKGDKVTYHPLHIYIKRRLIKPKICSGCSKRISKLDLANISGKYKRNINDWEWLCRKCHMTKDGRLDRLHKK